MDRSNFRDEVRGPNPPSLARAALLFAREIAYPDLRPSIYLEQLDDWADAVQRRSAPADSTLTRLNTLTGFLFNDVGLRGNRDQYTDPRNSYLNEVISRGLGLPISLSVIFIEVAGRLGLQAYGIGLPGHFVVGVGLESELVMLDPFNGGVKVTLEEAAQLAQTTSGYTGPFQSEWLNPMPSSAILARMLLNLRGVYIQREDWPATLAVVGHLRILQPHAAEHVRDAGLLHFRNGELRQAAHLLEQYLIREPDAPDSAAIRQTLDAILNQFAILN
ncbi:MAG: transglutaminase family protein [Chloroflexi bacterium]|nr:transglutaminase family protein [Chloroflexota bacterium]